MQEKLSNYNFKPDDGGSDTREKPTKKKKVAEVCRHFGRPWRL